MSLTEDPHTTGSIRPVSREKERSDFLETFESAYKAPRLLRPMHKQAIKQYLSVKQNRDGTRALCCFCNVEFGINQLQIHHKDHDRTHNQLSNIDASCEPCNNDERKTWLAASYASRASVITPLKKENDKEMETIEKQEERRLLKQAPSTMQQTVKYKQQALDYLIEYVKEAKDFETAVSDVEAITGCSHAKAIEYIDAFSRSVFSPFYQGVTSEHQFVAPRNNEAYTRAKEDFLKRTNR